MRCVQAPVFALAMIFACGKDDGGGGDDGSSGDSGATSSQSGDTGGTGQSSGSGGDSGTGAGTETASGSETQGTGTGTGTDTGTDTATATSTSTLPCWESVPEANMGDEAQSVQTTWGAPCEIDADCEALLGPGALCFAEAVVFELPGGICTRPCSLPDSTTTVVRDDPDCDPGGGVHCLGAMGIFEACSPECTSHEQCGRDGYMCRQMPEIAQPSDPSFCLMPDCCLDGC